MSLAGVAVDDKAPAPYWAALRTKGNCEERATRCLRQIGFEVYLPRAVERRVNRRGRRVRVVKPLFASYVFLLITHEWRPALILNSVVGIVTNGGKTAMPGAVPICVIDEIKAREAAALTEAAKPEPAKLKVGGVAKVRGGPLDDRLGLIVKVGRAKVKLTMAMFGGTEREIEFNRESVEPI